MTTNLNGLFAEAQNFERNGQLQQAEALYRKVVTHDPAHHAAWHALGLLAYNAGDLPLAVQCIDAAIANNRKLALYHRNQGEMYRRMGHLDKSIQAGRKASRLSPKALDAHYNLGLAYSDAGNLEHAIRCYRKALAIDQGHGLSWNNLGSALEQQGHKAAAQEAYARAVQLNPQHAEAQNNLGAIYSEQGKLVQAIDCFNAAIAARPAFVEAHYNLSSLKTYAADDPHLAMLEAVFARREQLADHARIRYSFALGKALDDTAQYDRAFLAYEEGNRLQHRLLPFDEALADQLLARIVATFDEKFFADRKDWQGARNDQRRPIFVVGMPRSGTTLLEQILASHPSVYGAGELTDLNEVIARATAAASDGAFVDGVVSLTGEDLKRMGDNYLQQVWKLSPDSRYITDKMPANFFYLGLIHLALPDAKIIHAMRDPMDSCFSCFSRLFNDSMAFAYDQGSLGRYYARYITMMRHWHKVLPAGSILDLPYEKMVEDTEAQARRVLEFVGLPWNKECLNFHQNNRVVKTASLAQVRKPIYKTSVARWKHFAGHLGVLYQLVRDYRQNDDLPAVLQVTAQAQPAVPAALQHPNALHLQGIELYRAGQFSEALERYDQALMLAPDFPAALNSKGYVLQDLGRMEEALACFSRAVALSPEMAMARLNLGMAQLKLGDWEQGWENYESRWTGSSEAGNGTLNKLACPLPQWDGSGDTSNQSLLVITEQGFGDTFQFVRFLPMAAGKFARVGFVCSPATQRLVEWAFGNQVMTFTRMPMSFDGWDLQCPLLSLPRAFKTRPDSIPGAVPYLLAQSLAVAHWGTRLKHVSPGRFRVGVAWAGRPAHLYDARRSVRFEQLLPILQDERITWVSLQKWAPGDQRPNIPASIDWIDWTEELSDFADTAALVSNLDMVLSIDSAMVHLAGALGKTTWMMNRFDTEWRWFQSRNDSPWYPTLRLFNQPAFGDWASVMEEVKAALNDLNIQKVPPGKSRVSLSVPVPVPVSVPAPVAVAPLVGGAEVHQWMNIAGQHQSAGRLREAEAILQKILSHHPRHAHALHLLGVVAFQAGHPAMALRMIEDAVTIEPGVAIFHCNLAEMNRQQGHIDAAISHGEQAVALDPAMASAFSNLGIAYYDAREYAQARRCHEKALSINPGLIQSINNLGSLARSEKDLTKAREWYEKALQRVPDYLESLSNLGAVLVEDDQPDAAFAPLERALSLQPNYPEALCNLGLACLKKSRTDDAINLLNRSLQLRPGYPESMVGLARGLHELDRTVEAIGILRTLLEKHADKGDAWCLMGTLHMESGNAQEAEAAYAKALAMDPDMADALTGLGNLRLEEGKIAESVALLNQAIDLDGDNLAARFHLTQAETVVPGNANLAALERALERVREDSNRLNDEKKVSLHYALGKAYDDLKEYDKAFPCFLEGARIKRSKLNYDAQADSARIDRLISMVDQPFIERLQGSGDASAVPIFVLGMPRSGTTLTEQIIASHPDVFGAGELSDLMVTMQQTVHPKAQLPYPENLAEITSATLAAWGASYVQGVRSRAPSAKRITDKMPANYLGLGLIPLLLPNAKIIHVKRNPVDTCLSCFTRLFNKHQDATYDLDELGRHYAGYARLMEHWRQILPAGSFYEVQYEAIVADMEGQARGLIEYCGLPWNDACLSFHKTKRNIRTASVTQVRQPIYNSSVERWRNYEDYLGPLLDALGKYGVAS